MGTQRRGSQGIRSVVGRTFMLLAVAGLASLTGGLGQAACPLSAFSEIPLGALLGALSPVIPAAWHLAPCLFGHTGLLESLLQVSVCCWQFVLAFTVAA